MSTCVFAVIARYEFSHCEPGKQFDFCDIFNHFTVEVLRLLGPQKSGALPPNSEADMDSFFDTLQSWALMFVHAVVEPITSELRRPQSLDEFGPVITSPGATASAECVDVVPEAAPEQTEAEDSNQDFSTANDVALPRKTSQMRSIETKTLEEAVLILSNVSSCCCRLSLLFRHNVCRLKGPSCACKLRCSACQAPS